MRRRTKRTESGFTLIEMLIVMTIMVILAGFAFPIYNQSVIEAEVKAMTQTVRDVRHQIWYHATLRDVELSPEGFPEKISEKWFARSRLPHHSAAKKRIKVKVVHEVRTKIYPSEKSFASVGKNPALGFNAWYNPSNGAFCLLVPEANTDEVVLARFYKINDSEWNDRKGKSRGKSNGNAYAYGHEKDKAQGNAYGHEKENTNG